MKCKIEYSDKLSAVFFDEILPNTPKCLGDEWAVFNWDLGYFEYRDWHNIN